MNRDILLMYLRKSRADNPQESVNETLERHERILQETAVRLTGRPVPERYIYREVVSGETINDRPKMLELLSAIEAPDVKGVLVVEPQRLSRGDWEDGGRILSSFRYSRTLIHTPQKTYDLNNKFDYKFFKMELSQGNDYLEYVKEILARGRTASVNEGNYIGSVAPYGYQKTPIDGKPSLIPYEPEAAAVRLAVKYKVEHNAGWTYIAKYLEDAGYMPRKGAHWNPYALRDICINPVNIGLIRWNGRKTVRTYEDGAVRLTRPRNHEPIYVQGKHEPILDKQLYDRLIAVAGRSTREKKGATLKNPLAGLLFCGNCGRAMVYRTYSRSAPRLLCGDQVHCGMKSSDFDTVYAAVIASLEQTISDFAFQLSQGNESLRDSYSDMLNDALAEYKKLDARQERLYNFLEEGTYSKAVFLERNKKLAKERDALEKQIAFLKENTPKAIDYRERISRFSDVVRALKDDRVTPKDKNTMLKGIVSRIEYNRDSSNRTKWNTSKPTISITLRKDFV